MFSDVAMATALLAWPKVNCFDIILKFCRFLHQIAEIDKFFFRFDRHSGLILNKIPSFLDFFKKKIVK